ncbi:Uncharacterised protein [Mycobacteroides abscessus subsp. abscessus]|nr:Uncharacterised protein [Mycobacteroides abscessus subsp. abscessus]
MISGTQRRCSTKVNRAGNRMVASSNRLRLGSCQVARYLSSNRYWPASFSSSF